MNRKIKDGRTFRGLGRLFRGFLVLGAVGTLAAGCAKDPTPGDGPGTGGRLATMSYSVEGLRAEGQTQAVQANGQAGAAKTVQANGQTQAVQANGQAGAAKTAQTAGAAGLPDTRSVAAQAHERAVNDVHILFYTQEGEYVSYTHASLTHGTTSFAFEIPTGVNPGVFYKTLIVGNAHSYVPQSDSGGSYTTFDDYLRANSTKKYDEMRGVIYAYRYPDYKWVVTGNPSDGDINGGLPMEGTMIDGLGSEIDFTYTMQGTTPRVAGSILFSRSVCRIDLYNQVGGQLDIKFVKVCNYRNGGYYFHNDAPWGEITKGLSAGEPQDGVDGWLAVGAADAANTQRTEGRLYAYSNIVPVTAQNDKLTTYLMIAGKYKGQVDGQPAPDKITYYRFNLAKLGGSQILRRNYIYRARINRVSGPGDDTQEGAQDAENPKLDYTVDDDWNEESSTVTDSEGNFLTVSRTQIIFDGSGGMTEIVSVKTKEGLTWKVESDAQTGDTQGAFGFQHVDNSSFSVSTSSANETQFVKNGHLKVSVVGRGGDLSINIALMQLSALDEVQTLLVDGRTGVLDYTVPGQGGTLSLMVQTGSAYSGWYTEGAGTLEAWNGTCTPSGADKGYLRIVVPTNTGDETRHTFVTVKRAVNAAKPGEESVPDVRINITQPKSGYLVSISPMPENNMLVLDAFSADAGNPNGISQTREFFVYLTDNTNYKWKATSTLFKDYDASLSLNTKLAASTQANFPKNDALFNEVSGVQGQSFWLNVFRTAPGDPDITGTVTVTAVPKDADSGLPEMSISFGVTIRTSCEISDVIVDKLIVADRNVGAVPRMNQAGDYVRARNFTNDVNVRITVGDRPSDKADNENNDFKGKYYDFNTASPATFCPAEYADLNVDDEGKLSPWYKSADRGKWYTPSQADYTTIAARMRFSKQRAFLVSDEKSAQGGKSVGCFFPLAGTAGDAVFGGGGYWSCTHGFDGQYGIELSVSAGGVVVGDGFTVVATGYSDRCVRARE